MKTTNQTLQAILDKIQAQNKARQDNAAYEHALDSLQVHKALQVRA